MNKTANFQLTQWEKTDRILMEEFNSDNEKIDRILEEHATALENKLNRKLLYRYTVETAETIVILGQKWVRGCNIRRDWRTATLRHSPHYLSSYHKWRKGQRFVGVFVHHGSCFGLGDRVKVTTVDILIRCDGVAPW